MPDFIKTVSRLFASILAMACCSSAHAELVAASDDELSEVVGQGINVSYHNIDSPLFSGGIQRGTTDSSGPLPGTFQNFQDLPGVRDNGLNWEFYRVDVDMVMKLGAHIDDVRLGGYLTEQDRNLVLNGDPRNFDNGWDIEVTDMQIGFVNAPPNTGHPTDEGNDPFTMINPYIELAFAPQCELFGGDCTGSNADSVFAGIRVGAEEVAGNMAMTAKSVSGFAKGDATVFDTAPFLEGINITDLQIYGQRAKTVTSFQGIPLLQTIQLSSVDRLTFEFGQLDAQGELQGSDLFWISQVRNSFTWPEQNAGIGPTDVSGLPADRDYAGWNMHINQNVTAHGNFGGLLEL